MTSISCVDATVLYGGTTVLDHVTIGVEQGSRTGVIGPNGVGKSTLLRVLAGELAPETGQVVRRPASAGVLFVPQGREVRPGETAAQYIARRAGVTAVREELDLATAALTDGKRGADDLYAEAFDRWLAFGAADFDDRIGPLMTDLGILDPEQPADRLSGGQLGRLALASVLLAQPEILLLDEPTNDLDTDGLHRLETYVTESPAGIVLVSHDRAFLAATVDRVVELDEFTRTAHEYHGGWDSYVAERAARRAAAVRAQEDYADEHRKLTETARTKREWARQGELKALNPRRQPDGDKFRKASGIASAQNTGSAATTAQRKLSRLEDSAPPVVREPWRLRLSIAEAPAAGRVALELRDAVITRGAVRLGPLTLTVLGGERIRFTGPNGIGKTTLLNALLGRLDLDEGTRIAAPALIVGEIDQTRGLFTGGRSATDIVCAATALTPTDARTLLAKFRLGGDTALRPADRLTEGERTRAGLAVLQARAVNCVVLDEPTNHLDIEAVEQVEAALAEFGGTVLLVTHDRSLARGIRVDRTVDVATLSHRLYS
ncbi:ABC-F family ATP-binding cassette domain-containing protein [Paractinoplanes lichenicola]|uniref:ABC-F family ATP-binding cassette domain-containing protein n=1 Tax=Paractinoplanes lichenicola TaxID=2802976 RepID=A0ABS1VSP9_9ACTN|nr:ABC-F family ATP-binding cassette domain-containing protein [Actinoplanes lichenicola]MBL7257221.1 ABC-F family ATP-binding cassette domain-containing protein [Actinoplanes lichenicola]